MKSKERVYPYLGHLPQFLCLHWDSNLVPSFSNTQRITRIANNLINGYEVYIIISKSSEFSH